MNHVATMLNLITYLIPAFLFNWLMVEYNIFTDYTFLTCFFVALYYKRTLEMINFLYEFMNDPNKTIEELRYITKNIQKNINKDK